MTKIMDITEKKVYIVNGQSGEYEDFEKWIVSIHLSKENAINRMKNAQREGNEIHKRALKNHELSFVYEGSDCYQNIYDKKMTMHYDYEGVTYLLEEMELEC